MRRRATRPIIASLLGALVTVPAATAGSAAAAPECTVRPAVKQERTMMRLIAADRRAVGAKAVRGNGKLRRAGRAKSRTMAAGGAFTHSGSMAWADGRAAGQNIAMAPNARVAFLAMLRSAGHRANIRDADWRLAGVGAARGCGRQVFFTLNFLGPRAGR